MKLILMEFVSLDGVSEGPGSPDENTDTFHEGGWLVPHMDATFIAAVEKWVANADAFLFGRRTYEDFARDWPANEDPEDPFAPILNGKPKYVAAHSPVEPSWDPTTVLSGDVEAEVAALKELPGRELHVHGSATLARSLFAAGLIDELRLVVAPVVVGPGERLFPPDGVPGGLKLVANESTDGGLALLTYEYAGKPKHDTYELGKARQPA
jgi:dihydrofolate reductase